MKQYTMIPSHVWAAAQTPEERAALQEQYSNDMTPQEIEALQYEAPEDKLARLMAHLDEVRWQKEQGGITVGGIHILTRDRDKTLINGKITEALIKNLPDTDTFTFTLDGADMTLTIGALKAIGVAIAEHVQRTVDAAAVVRPDIVNETLTDAASIDAAYTAAYNGLLV